MDWGLRAIADCPEKRESTRTAITWWVLSASTHFDDPAVDDYD
jgi:hypothetical protein